MRAKEFYAYAFEYELVEPVIDETSVVNITQYFENIEGFGCDLMLPHDTNMKSTNVGLVGAIGRHNYG